MGRLRTVLNTDCLDIIGDFSGDEHFILKFTVTPVRHYLCKVLVTRRNKHTFINAPSVTYVHPLKSITFKNWKQCPMELGRFDWKPETIENTIPLGREFMHSLDFSWNRIFYPNYYPFREQIEELIDKMCEVQNYRLFERKDEQQLYRDKYKGLECKFGPIMSEYQRYPLVASMELALAPPTPLFGPRTFFGPK